VQTHRTHQGVGGAAQDVAGILLSLACSLSAIVVPASAGSKDSSAITASGLIRNAVRSPLVAGRFSTEKSATSRATARLPGVRVAVDQQDGPAPVEQADVHVAPWASRARVTDPVGEHGQAASRLSFAPGVSASMNSNS